MAQITFRVKLDVDGDVEEMARLFEDYLKSSEAPFLADYGPKAWGGYEGPFVTGVEVERL